MIFNEKTGSESSRFLYSIDDKHDKLYNISNLYTQIIKYKGVLYGF